MNANASIAEQGPPRWELGFSSLEAETDIAELPVIGEVPRWLRGRLLRTGPAKFEVGADRYLHWFDGLAMLHRFRFADGRVAYRNRFLETSTYRNATGQRRIQHGEFATPGTFLERLRAAFSGTPLSDNGNVNIIHCAGRYFACTETPMAALFDPDSLATRGSERTPREIDGQTRTAHPLPDPARNALYNYIVKFGRKSTYQIFGTDLTTGASRVTAVLPAPEPSYMHSFAMSERYVVLVESPLLVNPIRLALSSTAFIQNYRWRPDRPTRFTIVEKDTGRVVDTREVEPFFFFHTANAFEEEGYLTVDIVEHPDANIIDALYLDRLRAPGDAAVSGKLRRYRFPLGASRDRVESRDLAPDVFEFPRMNDHFARRSHRYVYGVGRHKEGEFSGTILKIDVATGETRRWFEEGTYAGEPIFVASTEPGEHAEDDGVLLVLLLETNARRSSLQVLDAKTLAPLARCPLPHHVPFGFHGDFFAEPSAPSSAVTRTVS